MSSLQKNVASQHIGFCLNNATTGAPVTAGGAGNVVIDGGAQAACAGTFTHKGSGQWDYAPTQAETNGTNVSFAFTGTGAIQVGMTFYTVGYNPTVGVVLTTGERTSVADALLDRDMAAGSDTGVVSGAGSRTVRQALRILRNKWSIVGGTQTVTKEDDSTTSWSQIVTGTPGANPITAVDPT